MLEWLADWLDAHDTTLTRIGWVLLFVVFIYFVGSVALG